MREGPEDKEGLAGLWQLHPKGLPPNVITYGKDLRMGKGLETKRALQLLDEMQQKELQPNVITYNAVISTCEQGSLAERALQLFAMR